MSKDRTAYSEPTLHRLADVCVALSKGNYTRAKELFAMTTGQNDPPLVAALAEAFGMMLVKMEAREYHQEKTASELAEACKEQGRLRELLAKENTLLRANLRQQAVPEGIISQSPAMQEIMRQAERIAQVNATVLITGETGTGKGMLARHLHYSGSRAKGPFVSINCAAIPETLLESELFGIEKGVASGVTARIGRFEQANNGTIFLDEIGDMPLDSQAKILHVIENRCVERVGGRQSIQVNVRIIAATHRNLDAMCEEKTFRSDLYYRLNVLRLHIPALRERPEDVAALANHFLAVCSRRNPNAAKSISEGALRLMVAYSWPGNIRELENETERAALLTRGSSIGIQDLSPILSSLVPLSLMHLEAPALPHPSQRVPSRRQPAVYPQQKLRSLGAMEEDMVRQALAESGGNKSQAARILGISREGLRKMLKRLCIEQ